AFQAIRSRAISLESALAYWVTERTLTGEGEPAVLDGAAGSSGLFARLGGSAEKGRLLSDEGEKSGEKFIAVISGKLWRTRFAGDPEILGRKLILDRQIYTVVGVAAGNFRYPEHAEIWVPLALTAEIEQ